LTCYTRACQLLKKGCVEAADIAAEQVVAKLHQQCNAGDGVACEHLSVRLLEQGCRKPADAPCKRLEDRHPERAMIHWRRRCAGLWSAADGPECTRLVELGGTLPASKAAETKQRRKQR
jgi:hypothetical protein